MEAVANQRKTIQIALAGNPNTGKTTLFNALCGTHQKTGNYPGVTVEKKIGRFTEGQLDFTVVDLPGLYSLRPAAPDERIAADVLTGRESTTLKPELVLFVLDSTNLQRNLHLLIQLTELELPVAVVLTMTDLLSKSGITVDVQLLQEKLKLPIFTVNVRESQSLSQLRKSLANIANQSQLKSEPLSIGYLPKSVESLLNQLSQATAAKLSRFELLSLIFYPNETGSWLKAHSPLDSFNIETVRQQINESFAPSMLTQARYQATTDIINYCETRSSQKKLSTTDRIDKFLTHRVFGLIAFLAVMLFVFQSIYTFAAPIMDFIENSFGWLGGLIGSIDGLSPLVQSFLVDGIIAGVGSVLVFIPQIAILFALIAFLEDSGYLARASFLMDRLLGWTGLNGRSFIPLLSSFACAIPGIMSARVIADEKARKATILIAPLMSCSARLPVYILFIGAFIEPQYGTVAAVASLFAMHLLGIAVALPAAFILNRGILKTQQMPFIMEMPAYHIPVARNVLLRVKDATLSFTRKAGTIIFAFSIIIWAASYFPHNERAAKEHVEPLMTQLQLLRSLPESEMTEQFELDKQSLTNQIENDKASFLLENSYLGKMGRFIQPAFAPLGFDWKLSVGILSAFPAREVIIATLGIINNVGADADEDSTDLRSSLVNAKDDQGLPVYNALTAITLMVFFALCSQCMSTLATIQKELSNWKYPVGVFVYMTALAYLLALIVYQVGGLLFGF
ncbi:MAG: ferrous iron transport protein B [Leptonema sp. (in: Bacteria)]|nr:ferrous iron transport protein B [Leptonema sp. (in: bacteria)]